MIQHGTLAPRVIDVLELLSNELPDFQCVAVRSIDSERNPAEVQRVLAAFQIPSTPVMDQVIVSRADSQRLVNRQLLAGFDELWFSSKSVWSSSIPDDLVLTVDGWTCANGLPNGLRDLMDRCACSLAIGDGCGLNFVTPDQSFAARLRTTFDECR